MQRDDESDPRVSEIVGTPEDVQSGSAATVSIANYSRQVCGARQAPIARKLLGRQLPPCFDGILAARRLRPFFRRRLSTALPHRVLIRARNPCLRIRRLFLGL